MMKTRCLTLVMIVAVATTAVAQDLVVQPDRSPRLVIQPERAPAYSGTAVYAPNGWYGPYPGIIAPVPYPNWDYPPHWIYSYMRFDDPRRGVRAEDRRDDDDRGGRTYRGRETLDPAVPYSEYLKDYKDMVKPQGSAKPAPTVDKALLEVVMPRDKARLFFDGTEAVGEGATRVFHTPSLEAGKSYSFTLKATWPAGLLDDDHATEQTISFRAGEHKIIDLRPKN